jgi:hypothetical protein
MRESCGHILDLPHHQDRRHKAQRQTTKTTRRESTANLLTPAMPTTRSASRSRSTISPSNSIVSSPSQSTSASASASASTSTPIRLSTPTPVHMQNMFTPPHSQSHLQQGSNPSTLPDRRDPPRNSGNRKHIPTPILIPTRQKVLPR